MSIVKIKNKIDSTKRNSEKSKTKIRLAINEKDNSSQKQENSKFKFLSPK